MGHALRLCPIVGGGAFDAPPEQASAGDGSPFPHCREGYSEALLASEKAPEAESVGIGHGSELPGEGGAGGGVLRRLSRVAGKLGK